ncbi:MAG TPA: oxygenase MpaB family protein [Gaiellaceae bacterium]|nr:oxygenase MpaB family protein [Gaiellaceae bacterium]
MADGRTFAGDSRAITHAQRLRSRDGYFAPESVIRRLGNTPLVPFLGGGPAVLLQVAHPLVAAGVSDHSEVGHDLWRRLVQTLRALYLIAFGTKEEADRAAEVVQAVHTRVRGCTRTQLGPFPPGTPYSAADPELMLWVHATLVQASLAAYERFVGSLSREDRERYYQEMALVARLFGTPAGVIPRSLSDFREYFVAEINGGTIVVTAPAQEVAAVILAAQLPVPLRVFVPAHRLSTAALLPPRLRDQYGLRWSVFHELALQLAARSMRITAMPVLAVASRLAPTTGRLAA